MSIFLSLWGEDEGPGENNSETFKHLYFYINGDSLNDAR